MNRSDIDVNRILQLRRILAAQSVPIEYDQAVLATNHALLQQYLHGNLNQWYPFIQRPSPLELTAGDANLQGHSPFHPLGHVTNELALNLSRRMGQEQLSNHERSLHFGSNERALLTNGRDGPIPEYHTSISICNESNHNANLSNDQLVSESENVLPASQNLSRKRQFEEANYEGMLTPEPQLSRNNEENGNYAGSSIATEQKESAKISNDDTAKKTNRASSDQSQHLRRKDRRWLSSYFELRKYKEEHGDCIIPRGYTANPPLASWVAEQRKQHKLFRDGKNSSITAKRIELLEELGFAWNAQSAAWDRRIKDLKNFQEEHNDCLVPLKHPKYPKLGLWVKEQRRHYTLMQQGKPCHMTEERVRTLNSLGFCWDTHEAVWVERLKELAEYKATHGDCVVPTNYKGNPKLGTWVHHQRRQYKKYKGGETCHITAERIGALESIGFVWSPRNKGCRDSGYHSSGSETASVESDVNSAPVTLHVRPFKRQHET